MITSLVHNPVVLIVLFLFGGVAWFIYLLIQINPPLPLNYELSAYRQVSEPTNRVIVTGRVRVNTPCIGGVVRTYFRAPGYPPEPAVRVWSDNTGRIGKSEVRLEAPERGNYLVSAAFDPPEWAQWIEWRFFTPAPCFKEGRGELVVGVVEIPERK